MCTLKPEPLGSQFFFYCVRNLLVHYNDSNKVVILIVIKHLITIILIYSKWVKIFTSRPSILGLKNEKGKIIKKSNI